MVSVTEQSERQYLGWLCCKGDVALGSVAVDLTPFSEGAGEVALGAVKLMPLALEGEAENPLLTEASIAVAVTLAAPLLTPEEAAAACIISLTVTKIAPVPDSLKVGPGRLCLPRVRLTLNFRHEGL